MELAKRENAEIQISEIKRTLECFGKKNIYQIGTQEASSELLISFEAGEKFNCDIFLVEYGRAYRTDIEFLRSEITKINNELKILHKKIDDDLASQRNTDD